MQIVSVESIQVSTYDPLWGSEDTMFYYIESIKWDSIRERKGFFFRATAMREKATQLHSQLLSAATDRYDSWVAATQNAPQTLWQRLVSFFFAEKEGYSPTTFVEYPRVFRGLEVIISLENYLTWSGYITKKDYDCVIEAINFLRETND